MSSIVFERRQMMLDSAYDAIEKVKGKLKVSFHEAELLTKCISVSFFDEDESAEKIMSKYDLTDIEMAAIAEKEDKFRKFVDDAAISFFD
jgi:hypothetical protein